MDAVNKMTGKTANESYVGALKDVIVAALSLVEESNRYLQGLRQDPMKGVGNFTDMEALDTGIENLGRIRKKLESVSLELPPTLGRSPNTYGAAIRDIAGKADGLHILEVQERDAEGMKACRDVSMVVSEAIDMVQKTVPSETLSAPGIYRVLEVLMVTGIATSDQLAAARRRPRPKSKPKLGSAPKVA